MRTGNSTQLSRFRVVAAAVLLTSGTVGSAAFVGVGPASAACPGTAINNSTLTLPLVATVLGAPALWAAGFNGSGVDVAVIDTGINAVPGLASSGKIVDAVDLSFDAPKANLRYRDAYGHGTNMAGIIAGDGTGGAATIGVAPGARLINVKVGAGDGAVDISQVIAALDWITQNRTVNGRNIRVVNLSFDTDGSVDFRTDPLTHAVENAWKAGIVVVVSAGNDGRAVGNVEQHLGNPALDPYVLAVAGSEWDPAKLKVKAAAWSSMGDGERNPDIVSPGASVASLRVPGSFLDTTYPAARVVDPVTCAQLFRGSGTSQSAAATSGAVALLLQQRPTLTPDQVKDVLTRSALPGTPNSVQSVGSGLINVAGASVTAPRSVTQSFATSSGTGSIETGRGTFHVTGATSGDILRGEYQAFLGGFSAQTWAGASDRKAAWTNVTFDSAGRMATGTWMGSTWSGSTWSGSTWSGSTWSGSTWSGSTWSGIGWS